MAVYFLHAVRRALPLEMVPLDHARGTTSFRRADDVDREDSLECPDPYSLADLDSVGRDAELANQTLRLAVGFGNGGYAGSGSAFLALTIEFGDVPANTAGGKTAGLVQKAQLNCFVPVSILRSELKDMTGTRLNHGDGNNVTRRAEYLSHPDLPAEQSNSHRDLPLYVARGNVRPGGPGLPTELPFIERPEE